MSIRRRMIGFCRRTDEPAPTKGEKAWLTDIYGREWVRTIIEVNGGMEVTPGIRSYRAIVDEVRIP